MSEKRICFTVAGLPKSKNKRSTSRNGIQFVPSKVKRAQEIFAARAVAHAPAVPHAGPVAVHYLFVFPVPSSWPSWKQAWMKGASHTSRPDSENLVKLANDALTGLFWLDDSQLADVHARKIYGDVPCTRVEIELVPEQPRTAQEALPGRRELGKPQEGGQ